MGTVRRMVGDTIDMRRAIRAATRVNVRVPWGYVVISKRSALDGMLASRHDDYGWRWLEDEAGWIYVDERVDPGRPIQPPAADPGETIS